MPNGLPTLFGNDLFEEALFSYVHDNKKQVVIINRKVLAICNFNFDNYLVVANVAMK